MNEWYEQAAKKLEAEKKAGEYNRYAKVMKNRVCETLGIFCRQDEEFAQAVVQGGTFSDCMKDVSEEAKNYDEDGGIPDLEAFRRAVRYYFPGADVRFHMTVDLAPGTDVEAEAVEQAAGPGPKLIALEDYL